jgi:hypothetical protein
MRCAISDCPTDAVCRGWCQKHYVRWRRTGDPEKVLRVYREPPRLPPIPKRERWEAKVDKSGDCWLWTGSRNTYGYGQLRTGHRGLLEMAHRLAWEFHRGPIPAGMNVLHACDNPTCVNPDHLMVGSQSANAIDMVAKGRQKGGFGTYRHPGGAGWKLDSEIVLEIRRRAEGGESYASISRSFDLTAAMVSRIVRRLSWRRVL